jgi:hypothetical protein
MLSGLKLCLQNKILTLHFRKKLNFKTEDNVPAGKLFLKKYEEKFFLASLNHRRRYLDPDPLVRGMDVRILRIINTGSNINLVGQMGTWIPGPSSHSGMQ